MKIDMSFPARKYKLYATWKRDMEIMKLPFPREWSHTQFNLPPNWREIALKKMDEVVKKFRSVKLFLDICVKCGACTDKCPFFLGTLDPNNMPVARQDLFRSVYKRYFTLTGRVFRGLVGAEELTEETVELWYTYFYQCSQCRRCSVFCPYGIDTAEIMIAAREVLTAIGLSPRSLTEAIAKCETIGNHMGIPPAALLSAIQFAEEEIKEETGIEVKVPINKKGAEILYVPPSADFFGGPHWGTLKGAIKMFHQIGLDYTISTYASEGGNFGTWLGYEHMKKINKKLVEEARRLGVKWILGGECGHMWRVIHAFMDTMNGPLDFLEEPVSPITGTKFEHAASTKMVHICEFTADLIKHGKLKLNPDANNQYIVTYHDSCNPARVMGLIEEPRYILKNVCRNYVELDPNVNREKTICCCAGGGLLADETIELRLKAVRPKIEAIKRTGANFLACICAIDKAAFTEYFEHYKLPITVGGVHELVGNALVFD
ncbi:MAG: (Fe-S)-binding protein [Thaumarchaeota archaeon]|jgi:Fe-S oxidoreductase|nr:(Fe-S)-binding protein [Candidatus Geocrenenecus arthurdayi]MCL7391516.1 (Fe-S)-binding protein [Candidatus Geocrenenecus arthurdayi]MCL7403877.1 (Fe-S)-binding protein [Candidatus Geocrenenecus arthurdayi]